MTPPVASTTDRRFAGSIEFLFRLRTRLCIGLWYHDPLGTPVLCSGPGLCVTSIWIADPGTGLAGPVPGPGCGLGLGEGRKETTRRRDSGALARSKASRLLGRFFTWGVVWIRALLHCRSAFLKCVEGIRSCEAFFGAVGSERVSFFVCTMAPAIAALQVVQTLTNSIVLFPSCNSLLFFVGIWLRDTGCQFLFRGIMICAWNNKLFSFAVHDNMILKISFAHFSTLHWEQGSIRTKLLACLYNLMQTNKRRDREVMKSTLCFESCKLELFGNCLACFLCPGPTLPKPY
jgi:hypothetical protein